MSDRDPSSSFCVLPWMHLFADESGVMYPCCRSVSTRKPNVDENGRPYHVDEEAGLERAWNSAYMRTLRLDMIAGGRPKPCERCYMYDDLGMRSHRQDSNDLYEDRIPALLSGTSDDGRTPFDLTSVDLRLGNLCNLRCRMCSPQSSRALLGEFAEAYGIAPTHKLLDPVRAMDWFASERFWEIFERHTVHVERLHFAGGEPLMIPQMFDFLARLVKSGRSASISLSYNTNLTMLPSRIYELWPRFRQVRVTASVDGFGAVNSFIRYPSDWAVIDANLRRLEADADRLNLAGGVAFNTTVQLFNVLRIDEFLEYVVSTFSLSEAPNLSVLTHPHHFSIQTLPAALKQLAAERLTGAMARLGPRWPARWRGAEQQSLESAVSGIIDHMLEKDATDRLPEFRRWTAIQDRQRDQRTLDVLPELAPLFEAGAPVAAHGSVR